MNKIFLNLAAVVLLLTSCSKYNTGKIQYIGPSEHPSESPSEVEILLEKINNLKDIREIEIESRSDKNISLIYWDEPKEMSDGYYRAHIVKKNINGKLEYIKKEHLTFLRNKISIKKEAINGELEVFVYLERDKNFLYKGSKIVKLEEQKNLLSNLDPQGFWDNPVYKLGNTNSSTVTKDSLGTDKDSNMTYNEDGTVLWITDTSANRIMIYANIDALRCKEQYSENKELLDLCLLSSKYSPMQPYGILGKTSFYETGICNIYDQCFRNPKGILYKDGKLYVVDSGSNRIAIFDNPSVYGCHNIDSFLGKETPVNCKIDRVIGREAPNSNKYQSNKLAALSQPISIDIFNGHMYIADRWNYRVVIAKNVDDPTKWNCTPENFGLEGCVFDAVIGQRDLLSYDDYYNYLGDTINTDFANGVIDDPNGIMKKLFSNPNYVKVTEEGHLIIASNEDFWDSWNTTSDGLGDETYAELFSRVLIFKNLPKGPDGEPTCDIQSFDSGLCDADVILGQNNMNKFYKTEYFDGWSTEIREFDNSPVALENLSSIELVGKTLILTDYEKSKIDIWYDYTTVTKEDVAPDFRTTISDNVTDIGGINSIVKIPGRDSLSIKVFRSLIEIPLRPNENVND